MSERCIREEKRPPAGNYKLQETSPAVDSRVLEIGVEPWDLGGIHPVTLESLIRDRGAFEHGR
ncbi:MAG: hypothetical protein QGG14_09625 [Planctomycetota bacterium]|jgi:hypothetical protein|nr:hypothetical protein [Planctomycetota bacterium]